MFEPMRKILCFLLLSLGLVACKKEPDWSQLEGKWLFQKLEFTDLLDGEPSQEYADFLVENEQRINDVFAGDSSDRKSKIRKYHNIRSLSCALQEFYRLYELLTELQVPEIRQYLYSFIAYMIVSRNGINRDGRPSFDNREEEIKLLYPDYRPELLSEDIREWIEDGIWSEESIYRHIHEWIQNEERI